MRKILFILMSGALFFACSGDDGDSIEDVCLEKCEINRDKCQSGYNLCLAECKSYSADMERKYQPGCGLCVAATFKYFIMPNGSCAAGVQKAQPAGKECVSKCFLPDGGR